ncbi:MAG: heavy metal translocating P-type ATPase [Mariniblastus sp.]
MHESNVDQLDHSHDEGCSQSADQSHHGCHHHHHGGVFGDQTDLYFAILCGIAMLIGWSLSFTSIAWWIPILCFVISYGLGSYFILQGALENVLRFKFEIDFLMIVAAIGAALMGAWAEGALLLFLFSLGHALEHYAMGRARKAIESLSELAPDTANVRRDGGVTELPVKQLLVGDVVIVKPNERLAADGFVIKGNSSVNQAPITGESLPVNKIPVDDVQWATENELRLESEYRVFAGTINQNGGLEIQVTQLASDSTLAKVVKMVNEAESQKSPTQRFSDTFQKYFVPSVLVLVMLLLFAFFVIDEPFSASFYRAMAVLIAASPCALAISTPSAVLSGVARAARGGVLVKGGGPLESLGNLKAIAFDKTGTLTTGKPKMTDVVAYRDTDEAELVRVSIAVEKLSDHPLAAAVVRDGEEFLKKANDLSPIPEASDVQSITGRGVRATINGETVFLGKQNLFLESDSISLPDDLRDEVIALEKSGRTTMVVALGERFLGVIGLMDTPREGAREMVSKLRELGVARMIMISGDNQTVASAVAVEVGIDEAMGDLMPNDKVTAIKRLASEGGVAMVGDGVNDAPAMANASVGIAMGAAGSDVALETADVALMADELSHLPFAVGLSRQTSQIIRQNLWISLGMVAILVPATIFGLQLGYAVFFHEGSTMLVVLNALRLLGYRDE